MKAPILLVFAWQGSRLPGNNLGLRYPRDTCNRRTFRQVCSHVFCCANFAFLEAHELIIHCTQPEKEARHHMRDHYDDEEKGNDSEHGGLDVDVFLYTLNHFAYSSSLHQLYEAQDLCETQEPRKACSDTCSGRLSRGIIRKEKQNEIDGHGSCQVEEEPCSHVSQRNHASICNQTLRCSIVLHKEGRAEVEAYVDYENKINNCVEKEESHALLNLVANSLCMLPFTSHPLHAVGLRLHAPFVLASGHLCLLRIHETDFERYRKNEVNQEYEDLNLPEDTPRGCRIDDTPMQLLLLEGLFFVALHTVGTQGSDDARTPGLSQVPCPCISPSVLYTFT
jgi:hypothetical protein